MRARCCSRRWRFSFRLQTRATEFAVSQYGRVTATLPWAVALEKGYFADAGIKIDHIISGEGGGTTLRNMLASDLPYGEVATSAALAAIKSGIDIVIVNTASDHIGEIALVANPKSSIHTVKDLAGKKAGFTNPKSTSELLLRLALKEAGMTGKVEMVGTGGFGGGLTLLDSGGIDAAPLIDPILTLKPDKYRVIFHFADLIPRMTWLVGVTTRKFATEHPEMVRKMIEVHRRGVDYIYAHHDDAIKIYAKIWQQKPDEVATYFPNYFNYKGEWSQGGFDKEALGKMSDGLELTGEVERPGGLEGRHRPAVPAQRLAEAALTGRTTGPRRWRISKVGAARTALIVLTFAGLEVLCRIGVLDRVTIIPPTEMVTSLWDIVRSGRFNADIAFTLFNTAAAIVLATTVGFFAGAIMHVLPRFRRVSEPLLSAYYAIPTFVFYPLLIVTFGVGRVALIVMGAMFGIVAMIVNTMLGLDHVPPAVDKTGSIMRLDALRQLILIRLPSAAPHLVTGVRLAVAYSVIGIVAGEFILATSGMGKRIAFAYDNFDNRNMYGMLLLLLAGVMIVNGALTMWENRLHRRFGQR